MMVCGFFQGSDQGLSNGTAYVWSASQMALVLETHGRQGVTIASDGGIVGEDNLTDEDPIRDRLGGRCFESTDSTGGPTGDFATRTVQGERRNCARWDGGDSDGDGDRGMTRRIALAEHSPAGATAWGFDRCLFLVAKGREEKVVLCRLERQHKRRCAPPMPELGRLMQVRSDTCAGTGGLCAHARVIMRAPKEDAALRISLAPP